MKAKRTLLALAATFIGFNLVLIFLVFKPAPPKPQSLTLPDGSKLELKAVTYGTDHVVGGGLAKLTDRAPGMLRRLLRGALGRFAVTTGKLISRQNELVAWFEFTPAAGVIPPGILNQLRGVLANQDGFLSGQRATFDSAGGIPSGNSTTAVVSMEFGVFPRRSASVELCLFEDGQGGQSRQVGRFRLPNPVPGRYPQWRTEPLPAVRRTDNVEVVLKGLTLDHDSTAPVRVSLAGRAPWGAWVNWREGLTFYIPEVALRGLSGTEKSWTVTGAALTDATGNIAPSLQRGMSVTNGIRAHFAPALWPDENAWKLRLDLIETNSVFTFAHYVLPATNQTDQPLISVQRAGITVTLAEFGRKPYARGNPIGSNYLIITHSPLPKGLNLQLTSVVQDNGSNCWFRPFIPHPLVGPHGPGRNSRAYGLVNLAPDARWVDIMLGTVNSSVAEFLVKPEVPTVPTAAPGRP